MSKYLALSDLDDTLLTWEKKITEETKSFLHEFTKKGNIFAICTGRPYSGALRFYQELNLNMPMVTDNGFEIYNLDGKTKLFEIDLNVFKSLLNEVRGMDAYMYTITGHNVGYAHNRIYVPQWIIHNELNDLEVIECETEDSINIPPLICNIWIKEEFFNEFEKIINKYSSDIFYRNWGVYYNEALDMNVYSIEMHSANASKGLALRYLKKYYNIDEDKTLSFGDQLNDISMIKEAYYGVAMINAVGELKSITNYQTEYDFNNNGVIEFIKKNNLY